MLGYRRRKMRLTFGLILVRASNVHAVFLLHVFLPFHFFCLFGVDFGGGHEDDVSFFDNHVGQYGDWQMQCDKRVRS